MNTAIKNTLKLLLVCLAALVVMELVTMIVYDSITEERLTLYTAEFVKTHPNVTKESLKMVYEQFSAPFTARLIDIILQGVVLFVVAVLIDKRGRYQKKYWASALLLTQLVHNFFNSNIAFSATTVLYLLTIFAGSVVGVCAIYLSSKVPAKRTLPAP